LIIRAGVPYRLLVEADESERSIDDPYSFPSILGEMDVYLITEGRHLRLDEKLGAHPMSMQGIAGVGFAVWAPNAVRVSLVGDFNGWDGRRHPMRLRAECGVWEIFMPGLAEGMLYKYEILAKGGRLMALKADPFAFFCEQAPGTAGIIYDLRRYQWNDQEWTAKRSSTISTDAPVAIYEVHLGSWRRSVEHKRRYLTYWELADTLIPYVKDMASPTSRCCRSPSIRSMAHGAISRWGCSRPPAGSAVRTSSATSSNAVIRPASA